VGTDEKPVSLAPERGEHTDTVLSELCGYSDEDIAAARIAGAFGDGM
jgi:crotonobetainyl-CoA:carnitine CoA-transferase CaiB-like acyl-CoA transferase